MATRWFVDSPGFGGAEINLVRVLGYQDPATVQVVHTSAASSELRGALAQLGVAVREVPVVAHTARHLGGAIISGRRLIAGAPDDTFVVWSHHVDSSRGVQLALAGSRNRFVLAEQVVPDSVDSLRRSRLTRPIKRLVARRARHVVVCGNSAAEHYTSVFGLPTGSVVVINNARDVEQVACTTRALRAHPRRELVPIMGNAQGPVIVCVARLVPEKGQLVLIDALRILGERLSPAPTLALVGDGPDADGLHRAAGRLPAGRVILAGHQPDPLPWLAVADVFVLPSYLEGLPGAVIEAMAAGVPVVTSDIPPHHSLVRHERTGLLTTLGDAAQLAAAIERVLRQPAFAQSLASAAYQLVRAEYHVHAERTAWAEVLNAT